MGGTIRVCMVLAVVCVSFMLLQGSVVCNASAAESGSASTGLTAGVEPSDKKPGNSTLDSPAGVWVEQNEVDVSIDDPPAWTVLPVDGEVVECAQINNETWDTDPLLEVDELNYTTDLDTMVLESAGTITVQGRIVYENSRTKDEDLSASWLYESNHPYPANANIPYNPIYGDPTATSVWLFFPKIEVSYPNDRLYVWDKYGVDALGMTQSLYLNLWVQVPGDRATLQLTSDGSTQLWGFSLTKFVMNQNQYIGVPCATVEIWDYDSLSGDDLLASTTTSNQGYFAVEGISNDDPEAGTQDVYLRVRSTSEYARVIMDGAYEYVFQSERRYNVPDGTTDFGSIRSSDADNPAWIVYSNLMDAWNTFKDGGPSYDARQLKAVWTLGHDASYGICPSSTHIHYGDLDIQKGEIHLDSPDAERPDTVLHECGHYVMWKVLDTWIPAETGTHLYKLNYPESWAWSEGWADFVPAAVGLFTGKGDRYYDADDAGMIVGRFYDMETSTDISSGDYPGIDGSWLGGDTNEATVSFALYDIYDSGADGTDVWTGGLARIWTVLNDRRTNDFSDYFDCFRDHYYNIVSYITYGGNCIKQGSRGTINYDPIMFYDDFSDSNIDDWTKVSTSGGWVDVDGSLGSVSAPCMEIYKGTTGAGESSSAHRFPTQGGDFFVEAKMRTPDPGGTLYFWVMKGSNMGIYFGMRENGLYYFDTDWRTLSETCAANTWYHIAFDVRAASGYFDIYINGQMKKSNAKFYGGVVEPKYLDTVKFQAGYVGQIQKTLYVDDVVIKGGDLLFLDQFKDNLDDWTKDSSGGPVTWDLTKGLWAAPSISLYKQQTSGGTSAKHYFSSKSDGRVFLEARVMLSTISSYKWCYVNLYSGGSIESYLVLRDGYVKYYSGGTWYTTTFSYSANTWFRIGIDIDLESGKYDLYGNGVKIASYVPLYSGTGSIDNVYLQAGCYNDLYGVTLWVDDITVNYR